MRRYLTYSIAALTLILMVWGIAETFKNGFTLWTSAVLVYLAFAGTALWLFLRGEAKNLSTISSTIPKDNVPSPTEQLEVSEKTAQEIILRVIRNNGKAQRRDLLPLVGLSKSSLGRLLDQMEAKGLIRQEGERKASYYVLSG